MNSTWPNTFRRRMTTIGLASVMALAASDASAQTGFGVASKWHDFFASEAKCVPSVTSMDSGATMSSPSSGIRRQEDGEEGDAFVALSTRGAARPSGEME